MKVRESKKGRGDLILHNPITKGDTSVAELLPYKRITPEGYLVDSTGSLQAYLRVRTTDLRGLNQSDLQKMVSLLTEICRTYLEPFKLFSMTYLTDTSVQQRFWREKVNNWQMAVMEAGTAEEERLFQWRLKLARDNLRRTKLVEENLTELAFFIVLYGKNPKELTANLEEMIRLGGSEFDLQHIKGKKQLEALLFRMNNLNVEG